MGSSAQVFSRWAESPSVFFCHCVTGQRGRDAALRAKPVFIPLGGLNRLCFRGGVDAAGHPVEAADDVARLWRRGEGFCRIDGFDFHAVGGEAAPVVGLAGEGVGFAGGREDGAVDHSGRARQAAVGEHAGGDDGVRGNAAFAGLRGSVGGGIGVGADVVVSDGDEARGCGFAGQFARQQLAVRDGNDERVVAVAAFVAVEGAAIQPQVDFRRAVVVNARDALNGDVLHGRGVVGGFDGADVAVFVGIEPQLRAAFVVVAVVFHGFAFVCGADVVNAAVDEVFEGVVVLAVEADGAVMAHGGFPVVGWYQACLFFLPFRSLVTVRASRQAGFCFCLAGGPA